MYGKDAECPEDWKKYFETSEMLPSSLLWNGSTDYFRYRPKSVCAFYMTLIDPSLTLTFYRPS
jgi:hypothetical protein